ncbi:MAG: hypothetical protein NUV84_00200 [Candidatus Uhrbacteria bacterium]|nr:hypothetical protein [Candidatus Uhrbacteria bacterium]
MAVPRPKPISLRPPSATHRRWFWVLMAFAMIVIAVGWMVTIRDVLGGIPALRASVEGGVDRAAEEIQEAQLKPGEQAQEAQNALDALQAGYDAEMTRQEEEKAKNE